MLAWIRSPRGSTTTATVVVVLLALFWLAPWQKPLPVRLPFMSPSSDVPSSDASAPGGIAAIPGPAGAPPGATAGTPGPRVIAEDPTSTVATTGAPGSGAASASTGMLATASGGASAPDAGTSAQGNVAAGKTTSMASITPEMSAAAPSPSRNAAALQTPAQTSAAPGDLSTPSFDVVRVEPTGSAVIAGRAPAGSAVTLMDGDKAIGHVTSDAGGQFVVLPDALTAGSHYLTLQVRKPDGQTVARSTQGVAVSIAGDATSRPLVALMAPDAPPQILSDGAALSGSGAAVKSASTSPLPVAIQSVEAGDGGGFTAAGVARPGNQCRVYLNGAFLADVTANHEGHWSVEIKKGMRPGKYTVRADEVEPGSGKVLHRAEVPFDYPTAAVAQAEGAGSRALMTRPAAEAKLATNAAGRTASDAGPTVLTVNPPVGAVGHGSGAAGTAKMAASASVGSSTQNAQSASGGQSDTKMATATAIATASTTSEVVIADLQSATVVRGDSLWRISRKMLGHGIRYTAIYASNASQIRDPALIYPGQIFVVPNKTQP